MYVNILIRAFLTMIFFLRDTKSLNLYLSMYLVIDSIPFFGETEDSQHEYNKMSTTGEVLLRLGLFSVHQQYVDKRCKFYFQNHAMRASATVTFS